jgi:tetratricopeptide (TPR) repeat protein
LLAVFVAACGIGMARGEDEDPAVPPDRDVTRKKIDTLIADFEKAKKKATLGLLQRSMDLSIGFGAPTWNQGDHEACCKFYMKTAEALLKSFGNGGATPEAQACLTDLKTALERARSTDDFDRAAWAMRFAFDKTHVAMEAQAVKASGLVSLGDENLKRSDFESAENAYGSAEAILQEMEGCEPEQIPLACRYSPIARSAALFGMKRFQDASAAAARGIAALPKVTESKLDLRSLYADADFYESLIDELKTQSAKAPKDASLQFLLGYQYYFTGHKKQAREQFESTLKLDPAHAAAKVLKQAIDDADRGGQKEKSGEKGLRF